MKKVIKRSILFLSILLISPLIILVKIANYFNKDVLFSSVASGLSLIPGKIGSNIRVGYYLATLKKMSPDVYIGFGSFFSRNMAEVGSNVYIGAYCIIGNVKLHDNILIASRVSIPSGRHQHGKNLIADEKMDEINFEKLTIGSETWIGEGAIVMADVGTGAIVGSGSVVVKPIPDKTIAVGNPAKPKIKKDSSI